MDDRISIYLYHPSIFGSNPRIFQTGCTVRIDTLSYNEKYREELRKEELEYILPADKSNTMGERRE